MVIGWREAAVAAVALFFLCFLLVKMRPVRARRGALSAEVRAARDRAHAATTPRERALALCEAGELAATRSRRWTAAAGFFLRAMNADPTWAEAVERAYAALHRHRPRLCEKMLWRRLAHLPWDEAHRESLLAAARGLSRMYAGRGLRDAAKAEVLRRLSKNFESSA